MCFIKKGHKGPEKKYIYKRFSLGFIKCVLNEVQPGIQIIFPDTCRLLNCARHTSIF